MTETNPKKPIALAITLVILVFCIMLNIVFVSKNIGLKQEGQVKTGKEIVKLLSHINEQSLFIRTYLSTQDEEVKLLLQHNSSASLAANDMIKHELSRLQSDLQSLFAVTTAIKQDGFSEHAIAGETPQLTNMIEKLDQVAYISDDELSQQMEQLVSSIYEASNQFNYKLVDSKTAMIRLSNGFEWVETLHHLDKVVAID